MIEKWTWNYKDNSRYYWRIKVWHSGESPCGPGFKDDEVDLEWSFEIYREGWGGAAWPEPGFVCVYTGEIVGQYDQLPSVNDILSDYLGYVTSAALGMAQASNRLNNERDAVNKEGKP